MKWQYLNSNEVIYLNVTYVSPFVDDFHNLNLYIKERTMGELSETDFKFDPGL